MQLLLEPRDLALELPRHRGELGIVANVGEVGARLLPGDGELVRRLELLEAPTDVRGLAVVVVHRRVGEARLDLRVGALELVDEWFDSGHATMVAGHDTSFSLSPVVRCVTAQASAASSVISGTPASALETGQPTFASSAAAANASASTPGTVPRTTSAILVIPSPGTKVTVADVTS